MRGRNPSADSGAKTEASGTRPLRFLLRDWHRCDKSTKDPDAPLPVANPTNPIFHFRLNQNTFCLSVIWKDRTCGFPRRQVPNS